MRVWFVRGCVCVESETTYACARVVCVSDNGWCVSGCVRASECGWVRVSGVCLCVVCECVNVSVCQSVCVRMYGCVSAVREHGRVCGVCVRV